MRWYVDPWEMYDNYKSDKKWDKMKDNDNGLTIYNEFKQKLKPFKNKAVILKMFSTEAVKYIPDNSLDFIFIDANHIYEYVKQDIIDYIPKVKIGGLIGGHDYNPKRFKGVVNAVHELFNDDDIMIKDNATWWVWRK